VKYVAWFQLAVGASILVVWPVLLIIGEVPQIEAGQVDIWFHLAAEGITALLLLSAGTSLLRSPAATSWILSGVALGALLYTAVNSAGYYAEEGEPMVAGMFLGLAVAATLCAGLLFRVTARSAR
jgi:hypothetical protein